MAIGQPLSVRQPAGVTLAIATVGAAFLCLCFHGKAICFFDILALKEFVTGKAQMGKSAGKTDIGESAPYSKMGRAQVRKGGVLWM